MDRSARRRFGKPPWQHGRIKQCEINAFEDNRATLQGTARLTDGGRFAGLAHCDLESQKLLNGDKRLGVGRRDHDLCPCRRLSKLLEDIVFYLFHGRERLAARYRAQTSESQNRRSRKPSLRVLDASDYCRG